MEYRNIHHEVRQYYTDKLKKFGATPQGVDWNSEASQHIRFTQLLKVIDRSDFFSLLDYGCGFGSLFEFMRLKDYSFKYTGFDISEAMIDEAKKKYGNEAGWTNVIDLNSRYDYIVASGIFNVRLETSNERWLEYILDTINDFNNSSLDGFSFNLLTKYSDKPLMKEYLYYADPLFLFDYCKNKFSKNIALLHDYSLYEFTLLIRKKN